MHAQLLDALKSIWSAKPLVGQAEEAMAGDDFRTSTETDEDVLGWWVDTASHLLDRWHANAAEADKDDEQQRN